jgi:hypothetical protein
MGFLQTTQFLPQLSEISAVKTRSGESSELWLYSSFKPLPENVKCVTLMSFESTGCMEKCFIYYPAERA